ncbi:MAG: hypothetical protein R3C03_16700 [Pirellulaceae bacterium]
MPPDNDTLSSEEIESIRLWIDQGAKDDRVLSTPFSPANPPTYSQAPVITAMDVSPDGTLLAINGINEVVLVDLTMKQTIMRLIGQSPRIESIKFSNNGSMLAVSGGQPGRFGELQVWEVASGKLVQAIRATPDSLFGVSWSPDDQVVAIGGTDNTLRAFNVQSGEQVLFQNVAEDWIRDTVFTVDGSHLISVGRDMTCKLTEVATERFIDNITSITPGVLKGGISRRQTSVAR